MEQVKIFLSASVRPVVTGSIYFLLAQLTLIAAMGSYAIATMWAPSGVLLGVLLLTPRKQWLGIILACGVAGVLANYSASSDFLLACGLTLANLAESLLVIRLLSREARHFDVFAEPYRIIQFAMSAVIAGLVSAAIATYFMGEWSAAVFVSWATTVILGMLIVTPIIVTAAYHLSRKRDPLNARDVAFGILAMCMVASTTLLVFAQGTYPLLFLPLAAVIMVTYLFGPTGAACSVFVIAVIGSLATANGLGPIPVLNVDREANVLFFQFFLAIALVSSFPLAALLAQRAKNLGELEQSNRMLEMAERAAHVGHWRLDLHSNQLTLSAEVCRIHGRGPDSQTSLHEAIKAYHPDDRKIVLASLHHTMANGEPFSFEARLMRPCGEIRHISSSGVLERGAANDRPIAIFGMLMDITDKVESLSELEKARNKAEEEARNAAILAETDQLTGLANRRKILDDLRIEIARAEAFGTQLTIAVLDVDYFKCINDTLGHAAGDEVLAQMGDIFTGCLRKADMVGRIGGEEFVIILPGTTAEAAIPLVERLRQTIATAHWPGTQLKQVTVSIGIARHSSGQDDRVLMLAADKALFKAKSDGRNLLRVAA